MDGTRSRRRRDEARRAWYARHRQRRFARFLGFDDRSQSGAGRVAQAIIASISRPLFLAIAGALLASSGVTFARADDRGFTIHSGGAELKSATRREAGKIPVVFIHGMLGRPSHWSVMIDQLCTDPAIGSRVQLLTFAYDSLQPISESGRELFEVLAEARRRFDAEGRDDAFNQVVLVGHSMGGLIAKAAAAESLALQSTQPSAPRVGRLIFVATPHRGVPVDSGVVRSIGSWLARSISPPLRARDAKSPCSSTSVDQLTCDHPLLRNLEASRVTSAIPSHSVIAVLDPPSAAGATDGLVPVASARLGDAQSEVVVRAPHGCYRHERVIQEVRRVLGEHARLSRPGPLAALRPCAFDAESNPPRASRATLRESWTRPRHEAPAGRIDPMRAEGAPMYGTP